VVNFDMPTTPDGYTHRIGRTGRAEQQGRAYTFVTPEDHEMVRAVERRIGAAIPRQVVEGLGGSAPVPMTAAPRRQPAPPRRKTRGQARGRRRSSTGRR